MPGHCLPTTSYVERNITHVMWSSGLCEVALLHLRTGEVPLSTVMRRLLTGYAVTYNHRHLRHGQLFQNRYKSILCQEDSYLLELVRYCNGDCSEDWNYAARGEYFSKKREADLRRNEVEDNRLVAFYNFMDAPFFTLNLNTSSQYQKVEVILKEISNYSVPSAIRRNPMSYKPFCVPYLTRLRTPSCIV